MVSSPNYLPTYLPTYLFLLDLNYKLIGFSKQKYQFEVWILSAQELNRMTFELKLGDSSVNK